jgi:hypothetical protein
MRHVQLVRTILILLSLAFFTGCGWASSFSAKTRLSASVPAPVEINVQSKLSEYVPLEVSGGTPPYVIRLVSGVALIDNVNSKILIPFAGTVEIEVQDSLGEKKALTLNLAGNNSVLTNAPTSFKVTNDFSKIYFIRQSVSLQNELYRVNSDGSGLINIFSAGTIVGGHTVNEVQSFELSPENTKIAFVAMDSTNIKRLYVCDMDGTNIIQLSGDYTNILQGVLSFKFISDSKIVYRDGEQEDSGDVEPWMRVVNTDGTGKVLVHPDIGNNGDPNQVLSYKFSQDLSKVFYFTEVGGSGYTGLYVTNSDGSSNVSFSRLTPNAVDYWTSQSSSFAIASDNSFAVITRIFVDVEVCSADTSGCLSYPGNYFASGDISPNNDFVIGYNFTGMVKDLMNTSINQKVTLGAGSNTYFYVNGTNFIYMSDGSADGAIFRTPLTTAVAPTWVQISPVFPVFASINQVVVSPDHQVIIFSVDDQTDQIYRFYKMDPDGSNATAIPNVEFDVRANGDLTPNILNISSDHKRALIRSGDDLYLIDLENGEKLQVTDRPEQGSSLGFMEVLDDVRQIFYVADQNTLGLSEIFKIVYPF